MDDEKVIFKNTYFSFLQGDEAGNINTEKAIEFVNSNFPVTDKEKLSSVIKSCAERSKTLFQYCVKKKKNKRSILL